LMGARTVAVGSGKKRPLEYTQIQPRPPNGDSTTTTMSPMFSSPVGVVPGTATGTPDQPRKKRGRPTKIEVEKRRQEALARGEPYPPVKRTLDPNAIASQGGEIKRKRGRPTKEEAAAKKAALQNAQQHNVFDAVAITAGPLIPSTD